MRRRLAWGLVLPLVLAGSQAAHALAYAVVYPQAAVRGAALLATGHSYLEWLPFALALAGACALVTLGVAAADTARRRPSRSVPPWAFALLAPTSFVLQEVLELSLHTSTFGWRALLAPTFLPGLALQLPFAIAAWLLARALLGLARIVGRALARARPAATVFLSPGASVAPFVATARCSGVAARAPPRLAVI